jgi:hypothetical protein
MTMMQGRLWSLNALAAEIEIDRRTLAKRLKGIAADGQLSGNPAWHMATVLKVLQRSERPAVSFAIRVEPALIDEIEQAHEALVAGFCHMRREPDLSQRREIATRIGPNIGRLDRLLERSIEAQDAADFLSLWRSKVIGSAIGELLHLCDWRYATCETRGIQPQGSV